MIKIAMVVFSYYPADPRVRREAEALVRAGMAVDVICISNDKELRKEHVDGVEVYRIRLKRKRAGKLRYVLEYTYFIATAFLILSWLHLREPYHVIHAHTLPDIVVLSAILPKLTGAKIILDMHEIMPEFYMKKYNIPENYKFIQALKSIEKFSIKLSDRVIVATPFLRKKVIKRSASPDKCKTILNLPDPKYFHNRITDGRHQNGKFRLIYPGSFNELHGIDIAIKAIHLIKKETNIPIEFHIYGEGGETDREKLISLTNKLNLQSMVFFHHTLPLEKFGKILASKDVGIVPKRDGVFIGEAMSTKLFEFAATGLPAIVSRTKGDSLYFDNSMVMFFEPENERQLANCIIRLYRNPDLQKKLSYNSKKLFNKKNWETEKKKLLVIYKNLLKI